MELTIEHLTKRYGEKTAVNGVSVRLEEGVYGLLGPNGSGKTTLMRMLVDILRPTGGYVLLNGQDIRRMGDAYRDLIGYLPQEFGVYRNFTAVRFLRYIAALKGLDKKQAEQKIDSLLHMVNLSDAGRKKIRAFSGGMRQRIGIAQALLNDPRILILDEPTAGLDPNERIRFRNLISEISARKIVLLSTHIVSDIEYVSKEVLVMKRGELVRKAPAAALVREMEGKVWKVVADDESFGALRKRFTVGNILRSENGLEVKIIAEEKPTETAELLRPTLEDFYLELFGEEARDDGTVPTGAL